ncbi:MAG: hypothetical protein JWN04_975 [Myxococcaceae bacterium]|nr:hypothetical protein [Myxococcaceae bacterium]
MAIAVGRAEKFLLFGPPRDPFAGPPRPVRGVLTIRGKTTRAMRDMDELGCAVLDTKRVGKATVVELLVPREDLALLCYGTQTERYTFEPDPEDVSAQRQWEQWIWSESGVAIRDHVAARKRAAARRQAKANRARKAART